MPGGLARRRPRLAQGSRDWLATSRTPVGNRDRRGNANRSACRTFISLNWTERCRMASATSWAALAGCASALTMTRPASRSTPSASGGNRSRYRPGAASGRRPWPRCRRWLPPRVGRRRARRERTGEGMPRRWRGGTSAGRGGCCNEMDSLCAPPAAALCPAQGAGALRRSCREDSPVGWVAATCGADRVLMRGAGLAERWVSYFGRAWRGDVRLNGQTARFRPMDDIRTGLQHRLSHRKELAAGRCRILEVCFGEAKRFVCVSLTGTGNDCASVVCAQSR